jgi:hypothetical protein
MTWKGLDSICREFYLPYNNKKSIVSSHLSVHVFDCLFPTKRLLNQLTILINVGIIIPTDATLLLYFIILFCQ